MVPRYRAKRSGEARIEKAHGVSFLQDQRSLLGLWARSAALGTETGETECYELAKTARFTLQMIRLYLGNEVSRNLAKIPEELAAG